MAEENKKPGGFWTEMNSAFRQGFKDAEKEKAAKEGPENEDDGSKKSGLGSKIVGAVKRNLPDISAIIMGAVSGSPAVMLGVKYMMDGVTKHFKSMFGAKDKEELTTKDKAKDKEKKGEVLSSEFENKLFNILESIEKFLFTFWWDKRNF